MEQQIRITAAPSPVDGLKCTFEADRPILEGRSFYFHTAERAAGSPLAERILAIEEVQALVVSHNRVEIELNQPMDWRVIGKQVGGIIREELESEGPAFSAELFAQLTPAAEIRHLVEQVLETQVNPMVASHGGVIRLLDVRENVVYIEMGGGCQGCGMASATLRQGVEKLIREFVPDVGDILDSTDHASGQNPYYASTGLS